MKSQLIIVITMLMLSTHIAYTQDIKYNTFNTDDNVSALKDTLIALAERTNHPLFKLSCESMLKVINNKPVLSAQEIQWLEETYSEFINMQSAASPHDVNSYLDRKRSFVIAWTSPTDGELSFSLLKTPINWDENETYPLYIQLHGLWNVADNPINYMTYSFINGPSSTYAFEDGFLLSPWGRGNFWYQGISETDIWECIEELESLVNIDINRKFLCGHSMGGYGAWNLGQETAEQWAGLGIHAGALWYDNYTLVSADIAYRLRNTPVYFVCGTSDGLLYVNQEAYNLLQMQGNTEIEFVTFSGAHDYRSEDVERMYDWLQGRYLSIDQSKNNYNEFNLQVSPNPFGKNLQISFTITDKSITQISMVNSLGQIIKTLVNKELQPGEYIFNWEPGEIKKGLYLCNIHLNDKSYSKPIIFE